MKLLTLFFIGLVLLGATASQVNTYINGVVLTADQLNSEFSNLYSTVNSIDNDNIIAGADIDPLKINAVIEGDGLSRQVDGSLDVNVDGTTVKSVSGVVKIVDLPGTALASETITSDKILNGEVKKDDLEVKTASVTALKGHVALSNSTGASEVVYTTGSSGDLTNNLVNITTNGGPVKIQLIPGEDASTSYIECEDDAEDPCELELVRAGVPIVKIPFVRAGGKFKIPPGSFSFIHVPAAGTWEYKIRYSVPSATAMRILNVRLLAYEL